MEIESRTQEDLPVIVYSGMDERVEPVAKKRLVKAPCGHSFDQSEQQVEDRFWCPDCEEVIEETKKIYQCSHENQGCGGEYTEDEGDHTCCPNCNRGFNRVYNRYGHEDCMGETECEECQAIECPDCNEWCRVEDLEDTTEDQAKADEEESKMKKASGEAEKKAEQEAIPKRLEAFRAALAKFVEKFHCEIVKDVEVYEVGTFTEIQACAKDYSVYRIENRSGMYSTGCWTREEAERTIEFLKTIDAERHSSQLSFRIEDREHRLIREQDLIDAGFLEKA